MARFTLERAIAVLIRLCTPEARCRIGAGCRLPIA